MYATGIAVYIAIAIAIDLAIYIAVKLTLSIVTPIIFGLRNSLWYVVTVKLSSSEVPTQEQQEHYHNSECTHDTVLYSYSYMNNKVKLISDNLRLYNYNIYRPTAVGVVTCACPVIA